MPSNNNLSPEKRNLLIEQLEERVLFDAVPVNPVDVQSDFDADAIAVVQSGQDASASQSDHNQSADQQSANEIVFVDKSVEGFEDIVTEFVNGRDVEVFFINEGSAGLTQIADHLEGRSELAAVHIISHGHDALLFLGNTAITTTDLQGEFSSDLQRIGNALSESGDILIYGCELAATDEGENFIQTLSEITNADVAASDDLTGNSDLGGDWILERATGAIEAQTFASESYDYVLIETDAGFVVGTNPWTSFNETAVTPLSEGGTSSLLYPGAATANGGLITIDLRLTLIDTFDASGNVTTGGPEQMPITFSDFAGGPILLSRVPGSSVSGYEGHSAHIVVEYFDASDGSPLSVVGDFTFKDIDHVATGGGTGSEAVQIVADQMQSYAISSSPTSSIVTIDNGDGTTTFTNLTTNGGEADQERWISIEFLDMTQLNLTFTARNGHTGYGLSTANFTATPLTYTQPAATDDGFTTDQNTSVVGNVITSNNGNGIDSDPDGDALTVELVNGATGNVGSSVTGSSGGTFVVNSNGSMTFDPGSDFDYLGQGESATTTITYTVADATGLADTATVTVTVNGLNDNPNTVGTIPAQSNNDNDSIAPINVSGYFNDIDTSDTLTFSAGTTLPPGLTIDPNTGVISGIIDNSASLGSAYLVVITANDGEGGTITQSFTWSVANPAPTATNNSANVKEDVTLTDSGNVITDNDGSGVDTDPDNDALSVSAVNGVGANVGVGVSGLYGSIQIDANGNYTYTLNNNHAAVSALDNGETLNDSFTYTLTDGEGGTSTATVSVTIDGTNDAPIVGGTIPNQSNQDDETISTLDVTSYFSDPDGDTLTYTASNLPVGLSLDLNSGLITGTIDNSASQGGAGGVYTVNVTATDDNGESVSTTLTWTVTNPGPTANDDTGSTDEATSTSGDVITASDTDPDGDTLTVNAVNGLPANVGNVVTGSTGGLFTINNDGTYAFDPNGDFEDLDVTEFRDTVVTYTVTDSEGGTDTATLTVTVNGINDAPIVGGTISSQSGDDADTITTLDVTSAFSDPEGDALTYTATGLPAGLSLDLNSGEITGTIDNSASQGGPLSDGVYSVEVTATDDNGASVSTTFTWTVANPGPTATDNSDGVLEGGTLTGGDVILDDDGFGVDSDVDGDTLSVSEINGSAALVGVAVTGSNGGEFTTFSNGSYNFDTNGDFDYLADGETATTQVSYTVSDGEGGVSSATLTITVTGTNDDPTQVGTIPDQADVDSGLIGLDVSSYFDDADTLDTLSFTATGLPTGLSIDGAGNITGTLDSSASQGGPLSDGDYTVTVTADDGNGGTVDQTFTWSITNVRPVADHDIHSTDSDVVLTGNNVLDNDMDPDGDTITVTALGNAVAMWPDSVGTPQAGITGGIFTVNSDGSWTFDPNGEFDYLAPGDQATSYVIYQIQDADGSYHSAVLGIYIDGVNDAPDVVGTIADQSDLDGDTPATVDVTSAFNDPEGDTLTYTATGLPGGLSLDSNTGEITGTVDADASQGGPVLDGVYAVEVTASDTGGESSSTTFLWTIGNPAPTAADNSGSVTEDTADSTGGNVILDNDGAGVDTDPDGDTLVVTSVNGSPSNVGIDFAGTYGNIRIEPDGTYSYDVDGLNPAVNALDNGETLIETITYTIDDGQGGSDTATLTITINGSNDDPVVGGTIAPQSDLDADTITAIDVTSVFSDPEGDTLTYTATGLPTGLSIDLNTGMITGTIDNSASQGGPLSDGVYTVLVRATDDSFASVTTTFTWTVGNPAPTATSNMAAVTEDTSLTDSGNVITDDDGGLGVDSDPDSDTLSVGAVNGLAGNVGIATSGTYGSIQINSDGSYTYTLDNNNPVVSALDNGETLGESFTYTLTDGEGGTSIATIAVTINGTNDTPMVAGSIPDQNDDDDDTIAAVDVTGYFSDPDGDTLTYTAANLPAGLSLDLNSGLITGTIDNSASQGGVGGVYTVTVTATDDNGATISSNFTWTVANPGPTATSNMASVTEDTSLTDSGNVITDNDGGLGVDSDPDGDDLSVGAVNGSGTNVGVSVAGTYGSVLINSDGSYTYTLDNNHPLVSALDNGETLNESFSYTVSDGEGGTSTAFLNITVNGSNDAPIVGGTIPDQTSEDADTIATLDVTGYFSDPDGDTLTYTALNLPSGLSLDLNSGLITGTIDNSASQGGTGGVYSVTVTATDDNGESVSTTLTWTVTNPGPTATDNTASVTADSVLSDGGNVITDNDGNGFDTDPDNDALLISAVEGVGTNVGLTLTGMYGDIQINSDGSYTYSLDNSNPTVTALGGGDSIDESFTYTITDNEGGASTATLTITINGANNAPVVGGTIPNQSNDDDDTITPIDVTSYFSDPDGDTLTYTASNLPSGLSLDLNSGLITGTIDNSASQGGTGGVYTVTVTAADGSGDSVSTTLTWTVNNPGPTATDNTASVTEDTSLADSGNVITDNDGSGVDIDPDNDTLSVSAVAGSASNVDVTTSGLYGSVQINSDGTYTYTLDNNNPTVSALDNGDSISETFTYTVSDGEGGTSTGTLTVTINGSNDAPVVGGTIPDQSHDDAETISTLDVTSYFSDPDGDTLTYTASNLPAGLSLDLNSGLITGTIDNSASQGGAGGVYTVSVTATDDNGEVVTSTFTWTVSNPGPTATDDLGSTSQSGTISGSIIANDFDVDGDTITVNSVNGSATNVGVTVNGTGGGQFTIESNGAGTFDPDGDFDYLADGETALTSVTYSITDSEGRFATATVTVTVIGTNDLPTTVGTIPPQSSLDGETIPTLNVSSFFDDVDTSDTLTFTASGLPTGLSIDSAGNITGSVDNSASLTGTFSVTVTVSDGNGGTVDQVFDWTVTNPAPIANDDNNTTTENATVGGDVIANDSDPDGDAINVTAVNGSETDVGLPVTGSNGGSFTLLSDGSYTFNPGTDFDYLADGETATTSVDYSISDGEGGTASATLTITVNGTNDVPTGVGTIPNQSNVDDQSIVGFDVSGYFTDADASNSLSFTAADLPTGLTINSSGVISGTIDNSASQSGPFTVTVTANDGDGGTVDQTFTWTVTNPGPTATSNTAVVTEDTSLTDSGNVITDNDGGLGVDSDPDGDALSVGAVNGLGTNVGVSVAGTYGSIQIDSNGDYTYTLDNNNPTVSALDNGDFLTETFNYTVSDGEGGTSTATLTITINGQNDAPLVGGTIPGQSNVDSEDIGTVDVSTFFTDPESDPLTYSASGLPTGLSIDSMTGEITGTLDSSASAGGLSGVYTVTVTATDDSAQSVSTTFSWSVTNPAPNAVNDSVTTSEDTPVNGDVSTNDSDPDGDAVTFNQLTNPANGSVSFVNDGTFVYTPDPDFFGVDSFDYEIVDFDGTSTTATVTIVVGDVNDPPVVATPISDQTNFDSDVISLDISGNFSDVEMDPLTFSATGLPTGLSMSPAGLITGTIDNSASLSGLFTVEVTANDGNGGTVTETFSWTVNNPGPTAADNSNTVAEDGASVATGDVILDDDGNGIDIDPDNDSLFVSAVNGATTDVGVTVNSTYGTIQINGDGTYVYTLDNSNPTVNSLDNGEMLSESFTYTLNDGEGGTSTAILTITINGTNDAPNTTGTIAGQSNFDADSPVLDVSGVFADVDGDSLLYSVSGLPGGLSINPTTGIISGTIDIDASQGGPFSDGSYAVTVTATDDNGETTTTTFDWTVSNPVPDAQDDSFTIDEDTMLSSTVVGNDSDPDIDPVTFSLLSGPSNGSVSFNLDGSFDYTPAPDFFGVDTFDYQMLDADGDISTATVTINVTAVNDAPTVDTPLPNLANFDSDVVSLNISSNFNDVDGDTIGFSATDLPTGLSMDNAGNITGTIDSSASVSGPYNVIVTANDGNGGIETGTFTWTVTNPAPNAVSDSFSTDEDTALSGTVATNDVDPDGDALTFTLLSGPSNGSITFGTDGSFTYDPAPGYNGLDSFDYQVEDFDGQISTATATISIGAVNDLPVVNIPIPDQTNWDDEAISLDLSGSFSDPDGDPLAFSATGLPVGLSIDSVSGIVTGTIDNNASSSGPYTVTVTVDDGNGGTISDSFEWNIGNPDPVAVDDSFLVDEDNAVTASVATNDFDPDGDTMTFSVISGPTNGSVVWNTDGTFTYTPNANYHGTDSFIYQTTDADGATATAEATIAISPVNDAPIAMDDADTTDEDTPVTIDVLGNDVDPDGDTLVVSVSANPTNGTVTVNPDGSIEYTPDPDFNGLDSFDYEICDADGLCSSATVTINVVSVNDGPVAVDDTYSTLEDTPIMGNVGTNDSDLEGDTLTFSLVSPPANGSLTFNPDGTFVFVPNSDFYGSTTFEYEVCDSFGACDTAIVTINVDPVNDPPVAVNDSTSTSEDVSVIVNLLGNDSDREADPLQVVEINGVSLSPGDEITLPSGAKVTLNADGTAEYDPYGQFDDLPPGHTAIDTFLYTIDDGNGGTAMAEAVVTISGVNDPPVAEDDYATTNVDTPVTIRVLDNDTDVDMDDLAVVLLSTPPEGTTVVNPDGTITFTPDPDFEGTVTIHYLVEDPHGGTSDATVTIDVEAVFRFDSFTNFSESNFARGVGEQPSTFSEPVLSKQIFTLAPEPIFSGFARPGTQVIGRIYDKSGALVGEATANTDPGGNWMMQFHSARGYEFYRIEFEQVTSGSYDFYGYLGLNAGDNSYQSMEPLTVYDKPLSVEGAMETSKMSMDQARLHDNKPQGFGE